MNKNFSYWYWFIKGSGNKPDYKRGKPGYERFIINLWLPIHILIGILVAALIRVDLVTAANTVLLPLVGILIGLSFAWAGNAQALLQSSEIVQLSEYHDGGFKDYIFTYQTAILTILVTLVLWSLAGLRIFNGLWPTPNAEVEYFIVKTILFTFSSLTLRECWQVVLGTQLMLLSQHTIRQHKNKNND